MKGFNSSAYLSRPRYVSITIVVILCIVGLSIQAQASTSTMVRIWLDQAQSGSSGKGIAVTWDSSEMQISGIRELYSKDVLVEKPPIEADAGDIDQNPATDRLIRLTWLSMAGNWHPANASLAIIEFAVKQATMPRHFNVTTLSGKGKVNYQFANAKGSVKRRGLENLAATRNSPDTNESSFSEAISPLTIDADDLSSSTSEVTHSASAASGSGIQNLVDLQQNFCSSDFDESNAVDALTDGLLVIRYMFGFTGNTLVEGAVHSQALVKSAPALVAKMQQTGCQQFLDIDGNGNVDALTDGLIFIRWAFGFSGDTLIQGAVGAGATRTTAVEIMDHLNSAPVLPPATAARFLTQSTFGPDSEAITELSNHPDGIRGWLEGQFTLPASPHLQAVKTLTSNMCYAPDEGDDTWFSPSRHHVWWDAVVEGDDQLRQRVAFALSQILVVSDSAPGVDGMQFGLASYYDLLLEHAFGNYRDLLEAVTLHPVMGVYLSMVRNEKANPEQNVRPDENYAREVLQLFSLGVNMLNVDGTLQLDASNEPVPTYGQVDIEEFAKIFTGWNFAGLPNWRSWPGNYPDVTVLPMEAWEDYHETSEKYLLNGHVVPAGGTAQSDLTAALDNVFAHQNVAPFISKQLIQRLVTSNPTPAYVGRVAEVFNDNGAGVKGDLKAVVRAILLDEEARVGQLLDTDFGKLREPLLRFTHFWRAFNAQPIILQGKFWNYEEGCGQPEYEYYRVWWGLYNFDEFIGQGVLGAPSVFNFYLPDYSPPGEVRDLGLVAPEFQLTTENYVVNTANALNSQIQEDLWSWQWVLLDLTIEAALAAVSPQDILDHLNLLLLNGEMKMDVRQIIEAHLTNSDFRSGDRGILDRARDAVMLIAISPDYHIQR